MMTPASTLLEKRDKHLPDSARRLLLVDDDEPFREQINEAVQGWSFTTSTAATFREARQAVTSEPPFLVIVCDYSLPDGNGLEFLDWLNREMMIEVPFLLISGGVARPPSIVDRYEFLAKPFPLQEFRNRLERLCARQLQSGPAYSLTPSQEALASVYAQKKPAK